MSDLKQSRSYRAVSLYVRGLRGARFLVIALWLATLGCGVKWAFTLLDKVTDGSDDLPKWEPSIVAAEHLSAFPAEILGRPAGVVVSTTDGSNISSHMAEIDAVARRLQTHFCVVRVETPDMIWSTTQEAYESRTNDNGTRIEHCKDAAADTRPITTEDPMLYYTPFPRLLNLEDNKAMMAIRSLAHHQDQDWFKAVIAATPQANTTASHLVFVVTGNGLVTDPIQDNLEHDLILGDAISIPSALFILCLTLRSARYAPIPILSIGLSILSSFLCVLIIATPRTDDCDHPPCKDPKIHVSSVAPNLMMSVSIAMSVDYSLFFLSRWDEEIRAGKAVLEATTITMYHTGHTIIVSGLTLAACAMGLMLIPMDLLSSLGYTTSIVVACTMIINLTLTPALLLWNPCNFFGAVYRGSGKHRGCCGKTTQKHSNVVSLDSFTSASTSTGANSDSGSGFGGGGNDDDGGGGSVESAGMSRGIQRRDAAKAMAKKMKKSKKKKAAVGFMTTFANDDDPRNDDDDALLLFDPEEDVLKVEEAAAGAPTEREKMWKIKESLWYKFGDWLTSKWRPYVAILLITGVSGALAKMSLSFDVVGGNALCYSRGPAHDVWLEIEDDFGFSQMLPNAMLFQSKSNSSKENPLSVVADLKTLYAAVAEVMPTIANETHVVADQIQTFNWNMSHGLFEPFPTDLTLLKCIVLNASSGATIGGVSTGGSREEVEGKQGEGEENFGPLHKASNSFCRSNLPACTVLCDQLTRYVYVPGINPPSKKDPLKVKMLVEVGVDPDPLSAYGFEWLENARGVFAASLKLPQYSNVEGWLGEGHENGFDERIDMIRRVYKHFPLTAGFVAAIVFVLMGVTFGSVVIAIKAVVSIGLTLSLVYGIITAIYQNGLLESLHNSHFTSFQPTDGGLCWVPPVLCFCLLVGLGLDYHVFLLNRVMEFRMKGFTDRESVILGLAKTGGVITAAGLIMAVAFLGTFFAGEPVLQQLSMFIIVAVLVDTFIVRAMLVPSMMVTLGKYNWWPRKMPTPRGEASGGGGACKEYGCTRNARVGKELCFKHSTAPIEMEEEYNTL